LKNATSTTTETTTPSTTETTADDKNKKPEASAGAPETYADFTAPEGVTLDKDAIAAALPVFKELNLTQEQAQKLVEFQAKSGINAAQTAYDEIRSDWRKAVLADPDLSTGGKLKPDVQPTIAKAIDTLPKELGTEFRNVMNTTGVGDNPAFVKAMYKFAQALTEGTHVSGKGPVEVKAPDAKPPSVASAMYPNLK
jgi:hypothetical protein